MRPDASTPVDGGAHSNTENANAGELLRSAAGHPTAALADLGAAGVQIDDPHLLTAIRLAAGDIQAGARRIERVRTWVGRGGAE